MRELGMEKLTQDEEQLFLSAENGDVEKIKELLKNGVNVNVQNHIGHTPLMMAAIKKKKEAVELLVRQGANPCLRCAYEIPSNCSHVPEMTSCISDRNPSIWDFVTPEMKDVLEKAFERNSIVLEVANKNFDNVLHAWNRHQGNVEQFLQEFFQDYSPDARDIDGHTPLMIFADKYRENVVQLLLEKGADPNAQDASGKTALIYAARGNFSHIIGKFRVMDKLLKAGADPELADQSGNKALNYLPGIEINLVTQVLKTLEGAQTPEKTKKQTLQPDPHGKFSRRHTGKGADTPRKNP